MHATATYAPSSAHDAQTTTTAAAVAVAALFAAVFAAAFPATAVTAAATTVGVVATQRARTSFATRAADYSGPPRPA